MKNLQAFLMCRGKSGEFNSCYCREPVKDEEQAKYMAQSLSRRLGEPVRLVVEDWSKRWGPDSRVVIGTDGEAE